MANNFELLRQALSASESSIRLAKQILNDIEKGSPAGNIPKKRVLPGLMGTFDGENMVTESGEKHPVPANYASKSMLVVGDTLKLVEEAGGKKFKQIEHVKRHKTNGVLTKKDGKFHVLSTEGSYKVLPAAVDHFSATIEKELNIWIPEKNITASWAAIESVAGKEKVQEQKPKVEEKAISPEKKEEPEKKVIKESAPKPTVKAKEKVTKDEKPKVATKENEEKETKVEATDSKVVKEDKPKKAEPTKTTQPKPASPSTAVKKTKVKEDVDDEELA